MYDLRQPWSLPGDDGDGPADPADVVSAQFCLHYFWDTPAHARTSAREGAAQ